MQEKSQEVASWLESKFFNQENGIIFDYQELRSFNLIQDFIETKDHPFKTPVIYYDAFPQETAEEFIDILYEELSSKLANRKFSSNLTLAEMIANAGLKMIVIDQSYLHVWETTETILKLATENKISLILVGSKAKMKYSQLLSNPTIGQWEQFDAYAVDVAQHDNLPLNC